MRREHDAQGNLTRCGLTQGFSQSYTRDDGITVTLSRDGRAKPFLVTVTDKEGTKQHSFAMLGVARYAFAHIKTGGNW